MRALKLQPNDPHLLTRMGIAVAAQRRFGEAIQFYQQAIALDRNHIEAWAQLGITRFLRNDLGSAREALEIAFALNPNDTNALRHLALVYLSLGRHQDAIKYFKQLLTVDENDEVSRLDLAVILLSQQQPKAALSEMARITGEVKRSSKYRFYQGLSLQQNGQPDAAQEILWQVAELPADPYGEKARQILRAN